MSMILKKCLPPTSIILSISARCIISLSKIGNGPLSSLSTKGVIPAYFTKSVSLSLSTSANEGTYLCAKLNLPLFLYHNHERRPGSVGTVASRIQSTGVFLNVRRWNTVHPWSSSVCSRDCRRQHVPGPHTSFCIVRSTGANNAFCV